MSKLLKSIAIVSVFSMLFALLAALLAGCTPASQPPDEESGVTTTTVSSDAPTAPTTTEVTVTTVITQSTTAPTTDATGRPYPSGYTGRYDIKTCVTAVTQDDCLPFTVVASQHGWGNTDYSLPAIPNSLYYTYGVIIHSMDEWNAVAAESIPENAPAYDAEFFERGALVLLASKCGRDYQLRITNAAVSGDTLTLEMGYIQPSPAPLTLADWRVLIEMKKEDMEGVDTLRADYWKSRWAYPDEDA